MTTKKIARKSKPYDSAAVAESCIRDLREMRAEKKDLEQRIDSVQSHAIENMEAADLTSMTVDGKTASIIRASRTVIDAIGLKEALTEEQWTAVSSRVLDEKKLEAAIAAGEVSIKVVAKHSTETFNKPYIK